MRSSFFLSLIALGAALPACASADFKVAAGDSSAQPEDTGGGAAEVGSDDDVGIGTDGAPGGDTTASTCEVVPEACATPESGHSPMWSATQGPSSTSGVLSKDSSLAIEVTVLGRARVDKFEIPMQVSTLGGACDGEVVATVLVETCPGTWKELRKLARRASAMGTSSNYWWFDETEPPLPFQKAVTRYRFELTSTSASCKFIPFQLPPGVARDLGNSFRWYSRPSGGAWTAHPGDIVASPWLLRC